MFNSGKRTFAQNSFLNFFTHLFSIIISFVCVPYLIAKLGTNTIGLLSILWLIIGYFGLFDIGLGQATTKYLSEHFAKGERQGALELFFSSLQLSSLFGLLGFVVMFVFSYIGLEEIINIDSSMHGGAKISLQLLAIGIPAVIIQGTLRAIPIAKNRFDVVNMIQIVNVLLQWGGSSIILYFGGGLISVILLTVITRYGTLLYYFWFAFKEFPEMKILRRYSGSNHSAQLLRFGGWVMVAQIIGPLILFLERMFIGKLDSLSSVAYFIIPSDAILKLVIFPMSIASTIIPTISGYWISDEGRDRGSIIFQSAVKTTFILFLPISVILVIFHKEILFFWLGSDFVERSGYVLLLFSIGIFFHSLAQLPNAMLQAVGKPDITAKLLLIELPLYAIVCYLFTKEYGIVGTSLSWLLRVLVETIVLFISTNSLLKKYLSRFNFSYLWKSILFVSIGGSVLTLSKLYISGLFLESTAIMLFFILYLLCIWFFVFEEQEKIFVKQLKSIIVL
ncbi:MAG: oligosaccharide flippase family protein [Ignavibacteriae bacterium]|nr:oligosaccharide flippase family protein [Ignavibacteriota bacterium]